QVADAERAAAHVLRLELAVPGLARQLAGGGGDVGEGGLVGVVQDRDDQALVDRDRDADVDPVVLEQLAVHPGPVDLGVGLEGGGRGLDDQVVEADLDPGVGELGVDLRPEGLELLGVDRAAQVEVRGLLLGLHHPARNGLAHLADLELLGGAQVVGGGGGSGGRGGLGRGRGGGRSGGGALLAGGLDVGPDHPALGAAALDLLDVQAVLLGQPAGQRRGARAGRLRALGRGGRGSGGGRGGLLLGGRLPRLLLGGGRRGGGGAGVVRNGVRAVPDEADHRADGYRLALGDGLLHQVAVFVGLVLHDGLVGLDLDQHVAGGDLVADLLDPGADDAFLHGVGEARHVDLGHVYSP